MQSSAVGGERCVIIVGNDSGHVDESQITSEVFRVSLQHQDRVTNLPPLPTSMRYESAACVPPFGNQMYVSGVGENRKDVWKFEPGSGWTRCADANQGRRRHCATFVDDTSMYVLGGLVDEEQVITDSIDEYDVKTNTWTTVGQLKYPTCLAACAVYHNSIYVFGGRRRLDKSSLSSLSSVRVFDLKSRVCTELPQPLPCPMQMLRAVSWNNYVIIIGKTTCVIFDVEQKVFHQRNQFAAKVNQFGLVLENQRVFLIGGHTKEREAGGAVSRPCRDDVKSVEVEDIINNVLSANWTHHATLPQPAFVHAFAVLTVSK